MKKLKIKIIDGVAPRNGDIASFVEKYNKFTLQEALKGSLGDERKNWPDVFLLHVNDLKMNGFPNYEGLIQIDKNFKNTLIVLYSGGGINILARTAKRIEFIHMKGKWGFDVRDGSRFCIIERPISTGYDLKIVQALELYFLSNKDKQVFFEALQYPSLDYLSALAVLCQGYLGASIAAKEIINEDAMELIEWIPDTPERFSALADQVGKVKKASWWSALGNLQEFKEKIELEFIALKEDTRLEKFFQLIVDERGIEDYKIVEYCYKKIKEELGVKK